MAMDLRPRIAADIVDAVLHELRLLDEADMMGISRDHLVKVALAKFECRSLPFENPWAYGTDDPAVVEAFLTKYPKLRRILADMQAKARELWPDAEHTLEVTNDPEGCHTCREGQMLRLDILRKQGFIENDVKAEEWDNWYLEYPDAFGPERDEVFDLILVMPGFAPEESS